MERQNSRRVIWTKLDEKDSPERFLNILHHGQASALLPGPELDHTNAEMAKLSAAEINQFRDDLVGKPVALLSWVRHFVAKRSGAAIWGAAHSPLDDPEIEAAYT